MTIERREGEGMTEFTIRRMRAEIIERELEELATNFEGAGLDAHWLGQEIANSIRERIKNHHFLAE